MHTKIKIAVLDDWSRCALESADWKSIPNSDVVAFQEKINGEDALVKSLAPFDVIVAMRERTVFPASLLKRLSPKLKLLVTTGTKNSSIDMAAARENNIIVTGTELLHHITYEHTWALIMTLTRDIVKEDLAMHRGGWQEGYGVDLKGKTIGIVGLGHRGQEIARVARLFGMNVIAWSTNLTPEKASQHNVKFVDKKTLFSQSDIITIHLVLSSRTHHLVKDQDLALMKPSAYFVNTSRGPIVDETALVRLLQARRIAGAALDVFDVEPLPIEHPLRKLDNVILTGHTGYLSKDFFRFVYGLVVENIKSWQTGRAVSVLNSKL